MKRPGRREQREALKERRQAQQDALKARREALARRRGGQRSQADAAERRRRALLVALALILLFLLLRDCSCQQEAPVALEPAPAPTDTGPAAEPTPAPIPVPGGAVARVDRPEYQPPPPGELPWLEPFRLQVAARSPRLALCFVGEDAPGAVRWTTSVEPSVGRVSQHSLEPVGESDALARRQRDCVIAALEAPPYRLEGGERSTPARVSVVIEF
jgi:hypothetical protein